MQDKVLKGYTEVPTPLTVAILGYREDIQRGVHICVLSNNSTERRLGPQEEKGKWEDVGLGSGAVLTHS